MSQNKYETWVMPLLAELIGIFILTFVHALAASAASPLVSALTNGLVVIAIISSIGHISGAHINPAVTLGVVLSSEFRMTMVPLYVAAQALGALGGGGLAYIVTGEGHGAFALGENVLKHQGFLCEMVLTTLLVFVALMTSVDQQSNFAPFAVGFIVMIDILAGYNVSGGCMNPCLSLGTAVFAEQWTDYWIYWIGPLLGSIIAVLSHRLGLGNRQKRIYFNMDGEVENNSPEEDQGGVEISITNLNDKSDLSQL